VLADEEILPSNLPFSVKRNGEPVATAIDTLESVPDLIGNVDLDDRIKAFERKNIVDALRQSGGVQVKAAAILGIKERSLWHRIKKHQINISEFKT
jgi:transcriptional regulator with GAF, ATPase, and Fis domain